MPEEEAIVGSASCINNERHLIDREGLSGAEESRLMSSLCAYRQDHNALPGRKMQLVILPRDRRVCSGGERRLVLDASLRPNPGRFVILLSF